MHVVPSVVLSCVPVAIVMFISTLDMAERPSKCARKREASAERGEVIEETQASPVAGAAPRRFSSINFGTHAPARSTPRDTEAHASPASASPTGATQASDTPTRDFTPIPRSSEMQKDHDYNDGRTTPLSPTEEFTLPDARSPAVGGAINFGTHAPARSSPRDGEAHASPASATPTGATQASYTPTRDYTPIPRSSELWKDHDYNDGPPASPSTTEEHTLLDARSSAVGGATEQAAPATGASAERLRWLLRGTRSWVDEGKILAG